MAQPYMSIEVSDLKSPEIAARKLKAIINDIYGNISGVGVNGGSTVGISATDALNFAFMMSET